MPGGGVSIAADALAAAPRRAALEAVMRRGARHGNSATAEAASRGVHARPACSDSARQPRMYLRRCCAAVRQGVR
jgi:hypothetical protein